MTFDEISGPSSVRKAMAGAMRVILMAVAFFALVLGGTPASAASAGCTAVNQGALTGSLQLMSTGLLDFSAGDVIQIENNSTNFVNSALITYWSTSNRIDSYTIPTSGGYNLQLYTGVSSGAGTISVATSCTPAAPGPAITSQPTDQSAFPGGSATFSVTATDALSYRWEAGYQGQWSPIPAGIPQFSGITTNQ
ncbi:hypothetical protein AB4144_19985, partial [Rhizobiaceae sp. 2RAB30]